MTETLSDGAASILAFAAYHQLQSGQPVTKVVAEDGAGHRADEGGQRQLEERGFAKVDGGFIVFTDAGVAVLARVVDGVRSAAG